jgi:hypothetical protein
MRRCIYCGTTTLPAGVSRFGDEHIIPLALGGNLILPEACCKICEGIINREIETPVLSQEWGYLRSKRNFPTRKKKKRKTHITLYRHDGSAMSVSVRDYSAPVPVYKFRGPRILTGLPVGFDHLHWTVAMLSSHDDEMAMKQKFPEWNGRHTFKPEPYVFARLLAKIAYGYVAAEWGLEGFDPLGLDLILGRTKDDYFYTVGGTWDIQPPIPGGDHITDIKLEKINPTKFRITVDVRLFSQVATPSYIVVVGHIDMQNPKHFGTLAKHRAHGKIPHFTI